MWDKNWQYIYDTIEEKLGRDTEAKYNTLKKLNHLAKIQNKTKLQIAHKISTLDS
jgi:hypothetical protein